MNINTLHRVYSGIHFRIPFTQSFRLNSTHSKVNSVSKEKFLNIAENCNIFLRNNINVLCLQKNESGFNRINIPLTENFRKENPEIEKIRMNYWVSDNETNILEESIHNHPNEFDSFIVSGGYTHELFSVCSRREKDAQEYQMYMLIKEGGKKSTTLLGNGFLKSLGEKNVLKGDIVSVDKEVVHRVIRTYNETLSINLVYRNQGVDFDKYQVFLTKTGKFEDVKTDREVINKSSSKMMILKIIDYLTNAKNI